MAEARRELRLRFFRGMLSAERFPFVMLRRAVKRLEAKEINPELLSKTYPIELFIASFKEAIGFEECVNAAMREFGIRKSKAKKVTPFEELPEGLRILLMRRGFEIFLNRLMTLAFYIREGYRGSSTLNKDRLIEAILKAANLPSQEACKLLNEKVKRSKKRPQLIKALLLLGMKGYLFWNRYYGLTLAREPERKPSEPSKPEAEAMESHESCLTSEVSSGL
ncbi:MAG: hypothetical protein B6U65_03690 [Candidatus Wolframiiraptor sp. EX4484-121]|nr:MAG: hypothetical protein B6U65_03690 [Candidatus Wolframiiraptor sp. EX4484-121]